MPVSRKAKPPSEASAKGRRRADVNENLEMMYPDFICHEMDAINEKWREIVFSGFSTAQANLQLPLPEPQTRSVPLADEFLSLLICAMF